ncbi:MAG TPA: carboxypeptidase regulatory-like domain-containing protein, partial [Candidatus Solibacter sp.]|nr:carboxypeptidase regulatory-like domain-containing protein [Candidatus Solibacter sp.]
MPNAEVTVEQAATGIKRLVRTSDVGYFRVASLPPGQFTIRVTAKGFETTVSENFLLQSDQTKTFNVQMKIGTPTTEVSVTGEVPLVETGEAKVSGHIDERQVAQLPLVGRNFMTLVVLTPGVTGLPSGGGQAYAQATGDIFSAEYGVNLNANGQRAESNNFQVDNASVNGSPRGGVSNFSPSADAVQELRVSVNNFSAEYGRNSSAMVNVITKSGTNNYHGTAAWYHTNNDLTGRNSVFQPQVPVFRRNEANATFGGPIK